MKNKGLVYSAIATVVILSVPLILTLLNSNARIYGGKGGGWDWMPGSFLIMGILLFTTGLAIDFAMKKICKPKYRILAVAGIVFALFAIWTELAVDAISKLLAWLLR